MGLQQMNLLEGKLEILVHFQQRWRGRCAIIGYETTRTPSKTNKETATIKRNADDALLPIAWGMVVRSTWDGHYRIRYDYLTGMFTRDEYTHGQLVFFKRTKGTLSLRFIGLFMNFQFTYLERFSVMEPRQFSISAHLVYMCLERTTPTTGDIDSSRFWGHSSLRHTAQLNQLSVAPLGLFLQNFSISHAPFILIKLIKSLTVGRGWLLGVILFRWRRRWNFGNIALDILTPRVSLSEQILFLKEVGPGESSHGRTDFCLLLRYSSWTDLRGMAIHSRGHLDQRLQRTS